MKIIFKIAKAELRTLFYSPIAWVVFIAFFIVSAIKFVFLMEFFANLQEYNLETKSDWKSWDGSVTFSLFNNLFEPVVELLYLFVPLLTMGIMNREVNSGTIKLLYSSPVRSRHIVLGKFFGTMGFITSFAIGIAALMLAGYFAIYNIDGNFFISAMLGFYLLAGAYVAIGIFISSLTDYQIVAGVGTFVVLFLLHSSAGFLQQYDFVRDLTYFLSISGRAKNMMVGLVTTRDVLYFVLIILMFLSFSIIKLRNIKEKGGWQLLLKRYLIVSAVVLLLGYFSSRPGYIGYLDVTRDKVNTIHPVTQEVISKLGDEPLTVTLYTNLFDIMVDAGLPQNRNSYIWNFWEKYIRFHPNTKFRYVYYYDVLDSDTAHFRERYKNQPIEKIAEDAIAAKGLSKSLFKTPQEIRSLIDLSGESNRLVMELEYKGKKAFLRTYPNSFPWPNEIHVSGSISRIINDAVPKVLFATGHYERGPYKTGEREYSGHTLFKLSQNALINLGVDVDTVNLAEHDIPLNTNILVVADPRSAISPQETARIRAYLEKGGNAIFHAEPGKQEMLDPLLSTLGIKLDNGTIVHPNEHEMPHILISPVTDEGTKMAGEQMLYYSRIYQSIKAELQLVGATAITADKSRGFKIEPIFNMPGNDSYWLENGLLVVDSAAPRFLHAEGDVRKDQYITGVKMSRSVNNKEQRIIVTSDADFMSNARRSGQAFGNAGYSWCLYNELPKYTNKPKPTDNLLAIGGETAAAFLRIYLYGIPAVIIALGTIILIRRKRK